MWAESWSSLRLGCERFSGATTMDILIAYTFFTDGTKRPIFEQLDGRQYVLDDDGERA